ncbi:MAG: TonB-dependent receptor [Deltaproteobacteria bacterium]|nr:TonB-dependent receptor [Deltaproteobacteria bacterium]
MTGFRNVLAAVNFLTLLLTALFIRPPGVMAQERQEGVFKLEEVVITGTLTEHRRKDAPIETDVITEKEIKEAGAIRVERVLQDLPSIRLNRRPAGFMGFQIQGVGTNQVQILRNGRELIGTIEGAVFTQNLQSQDIDRIEVIKGGASVLYGTKAMGGAINLITKDATEPLGGSINGQYESLSQQTGQFTGQIKTDNLGVFLSGGVSRSNSFDVTRHDPATDSAEFTGYDFSGKFNYRPVGPLNISLYTHYGIRESTAILNRTSSIPSPRISASDNERWQIILEPSLKLDPNSELKLTSQIQLVSRDTKVRRQDNRVLIGNQSSTFLDQLYEGELLYKRRIGEMLHLILGGEYEQRRGIGAQLPKHRLDIDEYAFFSQMEVNPLSWLTIVPGARVTKREDIKARFSPATTVFLKPLDELRFRFSYGEGFRSPTLSELFSSFTEPGGTFIQGNPNLEPEKSRSYSVGVEYSFPWAFVGVSPFRHNVRELIECRSTGPGACRFENVSRARFQGVELNGGIQPFSYTTLEVGYINLSASDEKTGNQLFNRSRNAVKSKLRWDYTPWGLNFTTRLRWDEGFGSVDLNRNGRIEPREKADPTVQIDLRLAKELTKNASAHFGIDNLLGDTQATFRRTPGRVFYGGFTMKY